MVAPKIKKSANPAKASGKAETAAWHDLERKKHTLKLVLAAGLKGRRIRMRLTQSDLSAMAGVTTRTICMLESKAGASCSMDTFLAVASVLNMEVVIKNAAKIIDTLDDDVVIPRRVVGKKTPVTFGM